jgi:hypothetical protein
MAMQRQIVVFDGELVPLSARVKEKEGKESSKQDRGIAA